jgi:ABC-type proline/glycine betaine transport system substrate-binding protein
MTVDRHYLHQQISNGQIYNPVLLHLKKVFTTNTKIYIINPDWTIKQLTDYIAPYIIPDFGLNEFELVEVGQNGAEYADPIQITTRHKVKDLYPGETDIYCYIR